MSLPKQFEIKETVTELRKLQKSSILMIANRLRALIEFKKNEDVGISKRDVADMIGVNQNSVQSWRNLYIQGG
ncbi:MAG: helix-turn-helix domain-containing protein, partial [Bacteroidota bacterium]